MAPNFLVLQERAPQRAMQQLVLHAVILALLGVHAAGLLSTQGRVLSTDLKDRPVMKVVRLLQDMKAQLESELADDKAVHEELSCWCKTNDQEKTQAIELGEGTESRLETYLGEAAAKMSELKTKRDAALAEVDRDFDALEKARALRMKENKAFHGDEANLLEAVKACDQAIQVLKEYNPNAAGLQQVRAVAHRLQQAQVLSLGRRLAGGPTVAQMDALKAFLSQAQSGVSFLAIPGYQSYGATSGEIYGVLEQMKEDFEKDLSDAQKKELKADADFQALKAAKEDEIAAGRDLVAKLDGEIADLRAKHAAAFKELEDTQAQLALDRTFLANLKEKCAQTDAEFEARVKDRLTEIAAVGDTIKILNEDTSFDNFEKTVNVALLQTNSRSLESEEQQQRLGRVANSLRVAASELGVPQLAFLASRAQLDTFTKVKELIDKLLSELAKQQEDEVAHRDWCIDEMNSNQRSTQAATDKKDSLTARISDLEKTIDDLTKEISATTAAVADMQAQMKRASEIREAENHDYQVTVDDQRMTQLILNKALTRMQQVYAFMQEPATVGAAHVHTSGNHTDPGNGPARFTKYGLNAGGARVLRLLQNVISDSQKMEDDAISAEQNAQTAYENFMKDSNAGITAANRKLVNLKGAKATADGSLSMAKSDLKATVGKLEDLHQTSIDLTASCDFILKNFDARQAARTAEMNSLNEAKAILSGSK